MIFSTSQKIVKTTLAISKKRRLLRDGARTETSLLEGGVHQRRVLQEQASPLHFLDPP